MTIKLISLTLCKYTKRKVVNCTTRKVVKHYKEYRQEIIMLPILKIVPVFLFCQDDYRHTDPQNLLLQIQLQQCH